MTTLAVLLIDKLDRHGERVALHAADGPTWRARTWAYAARETTAVEEKKLERASRRYTPPPTRRSRVWRLVDDVPVAAQSERGASSTSHLLEVTRGDGRREVLFRESWGVALLDTTSGYLSLAARSRARRESRVKDRP